MGKRILNRADEMIFTALKKAVERNLVQICLVESRINRPSSPVYNPWEALLPMLIPVIIGLILIMSVGPIFGLVFIIISIFASSNLIKKKIENRIFERTKNFLLSGYENFCKLWEFGGILLVNNQNKKLACIAPDADWQDFIIQNFADLMVEKQQEQTPEESENTKQEEPKDETPRHRRRTRK